jgi:hypothetical protein
VNKEYYYNLGYAMGESGVDEPEGVTGWQSIAMRAGWKAGHSRLDGRPIHTVWVVNGLRPPRPVQARLKITEKSVWAELQNGTRKLFNSTFFFTELAARRRWLGNLDRASHDSYTVRHSRVPDLMMQYRPPKVYYGRRYFDPEEVAAKLARPPRR